MRLIINEKDSNALLEKHQQNFTMNYLKELETMKLNIVQEPFSVSKEKDMDMKIEIKEMLCIINWQNS